MEHIIQLTKPQIEDLIITYIVNADNETKDLEVFNKTIIYTDIAEVTDKYNKVITELADKYLGKDSWTMVEYENRIFPYIVYHKNNRNQYLQPGLYTSVNDIGYKDLDINVKYKESDIEMTDSALKTIINKLLKLPLSMQQKIKESLES